MQPIRILVDEPHFLLVDKPAGLLTQAIPGIPDLQKILTVQIKQQLDHSGQPFIGLPHRLDRGTSGVLLVARNARSLTRLSEQFHSRKIEKFYLAILEGKLPQNLGTWEDFVRKIPDHPQAEVTQASVPGSKYATLTVRTILHHASVTLVLIRLLTGRMHQIRVQAASRGTPVFSDTLYGSQLACPFQSPNLESSDFGSISNTLPLPLHALRIEFRHPQTARPTQGTCPIPSYWSELSPSIFLAAKELADISSQTEPNMFLKQYFN
ncbi:MAG: RNA pseudouridine synthase [Planctomycetales bacterium]|nr:RNA pseudouridine synthase [Planctomycetales bacterium]